MLKVFSLSSAHGIRRLLSNFRINTLHFLNFFKPLLIPKCHSHFSYTLRGKIFSENGKSCKLSFELEVCLINSSSSTSDSKSNPNHPKSNPAKSNEEPEEMKSNLTSSRPVRTIVGVRRKRLTGDAWCYKKVCEEILTLTSSRSNPDDQPCEAKRIKLNWLCLELEVWFHGRCFLLCLVFLR